VTFAKSAGCIKNQKKLVNRKQKAEIHSWLRTAALVGPV
jgi:hypothetical protein